MRELSVVELKGRRSNIAFLGSYFRLVMGSMEITDEQVGELLLSTYILPHCTTARAKFDLLAFMMNKVYALANGEIEVDNVDALHTHEVLLPGHLYQMFVKEKMSDLLEVFS